MVSAATEIIDSGACCREVPYGPTTTDRMKHTQQPETSSQRQAVLTPHPPSPSTPPAQRTAVYQLAPAPRNLMAPKANLPAAMQDMSSAWLPSHTDTRQGDTALPVIEGPRGTLRAGKQHHRHPYIAKRGHGITRSSFSDSFLQWRVEPLDDRLDTPARPFGGLVPTSPDHRRPSTPIVQHATATGIGATRRQRYLGPADCPRTRRQQTGTGTPVRQRESAAELPASTGGGRSREEAEFKDSAKEIGGGSFCVWTERTRHLRRASETSSKVEAVDRVATKTDSKEEGKTNSSKREKFVIHHLNYCSSRKTNQVVQWLREIDLQDSFEIIE